MVVRNRRVVENFILYKVGDVAELSSIHKPEAQFSPTNMAEICQALRIATDAYEKRYKETFPDLPEQIRSANIAGEDIQDMLQKVSRDLFGLPPGRTLKHTTDEFLTTIKWGHVIGLFVFAGMLACRACELHCLNQVDAIITWMTNFLDEDLAWWLEKQGGWENLIEWSNQIHGPSAESDDSSQSPGMRSVIQVGVIAACIGLGAALMIRK